MNRALLVVLLGLPLFLASCASESDQPSRTTPASAPAGTLVARLVLDRVP
jgi:hypothetical protein